MLKVLVLGANGMAGSMITKYLSSLNKYNIKTSARKDSDYNLDIETDLDLLLIAIKDFEPDIIINCIGLLIKTCNDYPNRAIYVNSYFPHWLEKITKNTLTKVIHLSTDCIFDGTQGNHLETDKATETSWYGKTKAMGEIINNKDLTLRLSIIGTELKSNGVGLLNWFLQQSGIVSGFTHCFWNGITTLELAKQIDTIIENKSELSGLYHLAPDFKINKYNLLVLAKNIWNKDKIKIFKKSDFLQDKTLINSRKKEYDPMIPNYEIQLKELYKFTNV